MKHLFIFCLVILGWMPSFLHAADATLPAVISGAATYGPANTTTANSAGTQITATGAATVKSGKIIINPGTNGFKVALGGALHCQLVPFFPSAPTVSPSPIVGTTGTVSVAAAQWYLGAATVTYSWSKVSGPGSVSFSPNATNAAKTATATFTAGGTYVVQVTATGADGSANSYPLSVTVVMGSAVPTVATAAKASPNPVTGKTTVLSVLGADDGGEAALTYTWATTGTPPAAVTYSANGTNAAKSSTATFTKAGTYSLQCTIKDVGNLTITSTVMVTVQQTATSVAVTPASANVIITKTRQYTALVKDQFGAALTTQPSITWSPASVASGTLSSTGLFTANTTVGGPYTLTATGAGKSGTATVTVVNAAPTVATAAAASPNPTTGTTVLSVLGADDGGEAALTYAWATTGTPPAPVTFSANGTNAAKSSTATLTKAGTYTLQCTIKDAGNLTVTSTVTVTMLEPLFQEIRANADPITVTGTTTRLFASGASVDDPLVTYTWSTVGVVPGPVIYFANGTHAAKNTSVIFSKPGNYIFCLNAVTSWNSYTNGREYVVVNVKQNATSLVVSPPTALVATGGQQTFKAMLRDQFGGVMLDGKVTPSFQWSVSGGGSISTSGVFKASTAGGPFTVKCSVGIRAGSASVTVKNTNEIIQVWLERVSEKINEPTTPTASAATAQFRLCVQNPMQINPLGSPLRYRWNVKLPITGTALGSFPGQSGSTFGADYYAYVLSSGSVRLEQVSPINGIFDFFPEDEIPIGSGSKLYKKNVWVSVRPDYGIPFEGSETITLTIDIPPSSVIIVPEGKQGSVTTTIVETTQGYVNTPPTITTPASANTNPVIPSDINLGYFPLREPVTMSTTLSVAATDNLGDGPLTYAWETVRSPPAPVAFYRVIAGPAFNLLPPQVEVQKVAHGYVTGDVVYFYGTTFSDVNGKSFVITVTGANTFTLNGLRGGLSPFFPASGFMGRQVITAGQKTTLATFSRAGIYTFKVTVTDGEGAKSTSQVVVNVKQAPTPMLKIIPEVITVVEGQQQQFTAIPVDQFGDMIDEWQDPDGGVAGWKPTGWVVSGGGTITNTGLFTAGPTMGGPFKIIASEKKYENLNLYKPSPLPTVFGNILIPSWSCSGQATVSIAKAPVINLTITQPLEGAVITTRPFWAEVSVTGDNVLDEVRLDGAMLKIRPSTPYTGMLMIDPPDGPYTILAEAETIYGTRITTKRTVTVAARPLAVTILSPPDNKVFNQQMVFITVRRPTLTTSITIQGLPAVVSDYEAYKWVRLNSTSNISSTSNTITAVGTDGTRTGQDSAVVVFTPLPGYNPNGDSDGDGVINSIDLFPNDPNESADRDSDGVGDNQDTDPNNPNVSSTLIITNPKKSQTYRSSYNGN